MQIYFILLKCVKNIEYGSFRNTGVSLRHTILHILENNGYVFMFSIITFISPVVDILHICIVLTIHFVYINHID